MPEPGSTKAACRGHYRRCRAEHLPQLQHALDQAGPAQLELLLGRRLEPGAHLGLTWPLQGEPDLRVWLAGSGWPLALPAVAGDQLLYRSWQPDAPLAPDACGIPAPLALQPALEPEQLVLLLVPALAVDRRGIRLGSGGGWYDRLRSDPAWRAVPALAVLPSACVVERLPAEPWDVPFDGWIDEFGCHWLAPRPC